MFKVVELTLSAAVATGGTFTFGYPQVDGRDGKQGDFENAVGHLFTALGAVFTQPDDFTLAFGASLVTVTYKGTTTLPQGTKIFFQLEQPGDAAGSAVSRAGLVNPFETTEAAVTIPGLAGVSTLLVNLGSPVVGDVDGIATSQSGAAGALTLDGALVTGGVATFDVPRNIIVDSGGADTATLTVTGTDVYDQTLVENITLNGTTAVAGKKAFKTVTGIVSDATISNGAFVGTGNVLGLPVYLPSAAYILAELEDNAAATAGTTVAGLAVNTVSTATTADVRGTYTPNSTPDGDLNLQLLVALPDARFLGNEQFAG